MVRYASLIGKKDPVATLATLILLSYAKLLSTTITALSFTVLQYPDRSLDYVWLADGNIRYFSGKHKPLALAAILIVLIGLPYTILLSLWQWIVRAPRWRVLAWSRNSKLNAFIDTYHVPYNRKYRFWTSLLLVVRVVLYITASVTVSSTPQTLPLITAILVGAIFLLKGAIGLQEHSRESPYNNVLQPSHFCYLESVQFQNGPHKADSRCLHLYDHNLHTSDLVRWLSRVPTCQEGKAQ